MDMNLTYDHTSGSFYYFRIGFFPDGLFEDVMILLSEVDELGILDLPPYVPEQIDEGTQIRNLQGSLFTAPSDLYLLFIEDSPISATLTPLTSFLEDAMEVQPIACYTTVPANDPLVTYPTGRDPSVEEPNIEAYPGWYVPSLSTKSITVASRKSTYPFWTKTYFGYWTAYTGEYNCEGLPYNIHVTCFPGELTNWEQPTNYYDPGYFRVDGYYRNIQSNASTWFGFSLTYDSGSPIQSLDGSAYAPSDADDPVIYFFPGPEEPESEPVSLVGPLLGGLALIIPFMNLSNFGMTFLKSMKMAANDNYGLADGTYGLADGTYGLAQSD